MDKYWRNKWINIEEMNELILKGRMDKYWRNEWINIKGKDG